MKYWWRALVVASLLIGSVIDVKAKREKKNPPKPMAVVESALQEEGGEHQPPTMEIYKVGYVEAGDTYFHVFRGKIKDKAYHVIIFDNSLNYLGYYSTESKPVDTEENRILLDAGTGLQRILMGNYGPFMKVSLSDNKPATVSFIPSSKYSDGYEQFEYRMWDGSAYLSNGPARFMMYRKERKIVLLGYADGTITGCHLKHFSREDREYLRKLIQ